MASRRHSSIRGKPAEKVRRHLPTRHAVGALERVMGRAKERCRVLDRSRRSRVSCGQSTYESVRVLGVDDCRLETKTSGPHPPFGSIHAAESDVLACQTRFHAVVYVLHVAKYEGRAR